MISHALTIVINELKNHLADNYASTSTKPQVGLRNLAEGDVTSGGVERDIICFSLVNINTESAYKNLPDLKRNDTTFTAKYENPPIFLNLQILITATHSNYPDALNALSRAICFFQNKPIFTQDNVAPKSITTDAPADPHDKLESFKLIFELYSLRLEEVNHLWGTFGGKQYPFVLYILRGLDLKFTAVQS